MIKGRGKFLDSKRQKKSVYDRISTTLKIILTEAGPMKLIQVEKVRHPDRLLKAR